MNKVVLIGNLARDPELRTLDNGVMLCRFTLAVNRRFSNAQGQREADFIYCIAWRQTAEFISRFFTKGRKMALTGSIQVRSYDAPDGTKRFSTEVVADEVEFVDRAPQSGGSDDGYMPPPAPPSNRNSHQMEPPRDEFVEVDDDELPF